MSGITREFWETLLEASPSKFPMTFIVAGQIDFRTWRETGLYATDPDDGEILYAYGYEADGAEIPAGATQLREIEFGVELVFDTAANVTAVISKTLIFATLEDLENWQSKVVDEAMSRIIRGDITTALHADTGEQLTTDDGIQIDAVRIL